MSASHLWCYNYTSCGVHRVVCVCVCSVRQRWNWIPKQGEGAAKAGGSQATAVAPRKVGPTMIIFIVGGMTYSEMRAAYEAANTTGHHVIIGKFTVI